MLFSPANIQNWPSLEQFINAFNNVIAAYGVQAIASTASRTIAINFGVTLSAPPATVIVWVIKPAAGTSTVLSCDLNNDASLTAEGCTVDLSAYPTVNHKIGWVALA